MRQSIRYPAIIGALFAAQAFSPAANAIGDAAFNFETARDLIEVCSSDIDGAALACRAFLEATVQYHDAISGRKRMKRLTCPPKGTTVEQARVAFLAWGRRNADNATRMQELPAVAVVRALAAAYPCR